MNAPAEIMQIREFLWDRLQDGPQAEQSLLALKNLITDIVFGVGFPFTVAVILLFAALLLYQPRISRGALWVPAFGLFGHTPKLYYHSRPPSLCGILLRSRKRIFTKRSHGKH